MLNTDLAMTCRFFSGFLNKYSSMRKVYTLLCCVLIFSTVFGQSGKGKISITILSDQKTAVESATVELLRSKDSALVKTSLTDRAGLAEFENLSFNHYFIRISAVGYAVKYTDPFELNEAASSLSLSPL